MEHNLCTPCETVSHCRKHGCIPLTPMGSEPRERAVGWLPIETGPTNVLVVALFRGKRPVIAHKNSERDNPRGWCHAEALGSFDEPNRGLTHYMPLPPAPTSQEKDHA